MAVWTQATGVRETGLAYLLAGLSRRHGQYEIETATTAIIELLGFRRARAENVDEALSRFETLRQAADINAHFELPVPVLSWTLLEASSVPRPMWPLVLAPFGGTFPWEELEFRALMDSLRRQGHIAESPCAGSQTWKQGGDVYFTDGEPQTNCWGTWPTLMMTSGSGSGNIGYSDMTTDDNDWSSYICMEDGWECCQVCGSYLVDEYEHDTESEDEIGADMDVTEWAAFTGFTGEETYDTLLNAYLIARRRFRAFTGRFPQSRRFPVVPVGV